MDHPVSGDDVGVHIGGVGGLHHQSGVVRSEQVHDGPQIVPGAAGDEDLVPLKGDAPGGVVALHRHLQVVSAAFRHIAVESLFLRLIVHRLVQRPNHRVAQGQGHIPHPQPQQGLVGVLPPIGFHPLLDVVE